MYAGDGPPEHHGAEMTPMVELNHSSAPVPELGTTYSLSSEATSSSSTSDANDRPLIGRVDEKKTDIRNDPEGGLGIRDSPSDSDDEVTDDVLKDENGREISPIDEVAAVVPNTDDPSLPCMTFRFWVMGLTSIFSLSFINQRSEPTDPGFFRESPMVVGALVVQLISYPAGQFMARVLPSRKFHLFGSTFSLNPGPFNVKEHVLITILASCGAGTAYAVDIIVIQRVFYEQDFGFVANLLLILTTQMLGYGMAGILRRYLVYPAAMIWPANLVTVALFNTLHRREDLAPGVWTRQKFFSVFLIISFCYYWIPAYIFPVITSLTLLCYIDPSSIVLSQLTGSHGLGMGVLALDWNTITAFLGSPLITPWWAQVNIGTGFVLFAWVLVPLAYYMNLWDAKLFPILTSKLYTTDGYFYDTLSILTPQKMLDETVYEAYGPLRITTFFALSYGISFAGLTAILTHTFLYHRKQIWAQWKEARGSSQDIHYKLMQTYKEVPEWWYLTLFG
ncbi:hypothetical protein BGZ70_001132, partial [Mortierella alpina]